MGFSVIEGAKYSAKECAKRCTNVKGCQSFNLYYERAPSVAPSDACPNPVSKTVLKCVYYGGPVSERSATNDGQWQRDFRVVVAGSNGYVNKAVSTPKGYQPAVSLGKVTMNVPTKDCAGNPTYLGVKIFQDGPFCADKCAAACTATSDWNRANPHVWQNGKPRTCQMFVTYILYNGTTATGQFCAMYDQSWPTSFATEKGQWRDNGKSWFNMDYSYMFTNTTGGADKPSTCSNSAAPEKPGVCRNGQTWNTSSKSCISFTVCKEPDREYLNTATNTCVTCDVSKEYLDKALEKCVSYPTCNADKQYLDKDKKACADYPKCDTATQYLDKDSKKCVPYTSCSSKEYLDKTAKKCVAYPTCDEQREYLDKEKKACVTYPTCDAATQYLDKDSKTCVSYSTCSSDQYLDMDAKKCVAYPSCDAQKEYLDKDKKQCVSYPTCDDSQYLDKDSKKCVSYSTCTADEYLDKDAKKCVAYPTCDTQKEYLDKDQKQCVSYPTCDDSQYLDKDSKKCIAFPTCDDPQYLDKDSKKCVAFPTCDDSQYLDKDSKKCVGFPTCDDSQYLDKDSKKCVAFPTCDDSQYLDKDSKKCVGFPTCDDSQYLDKDSKKCVAFPTCDDSQYLDKTSHKCVDYPSCDASTQYLDKDSKKCATYPTCNAESEYLDKIKKSCVSYPTCSASQTLNKATKTCETKTCTQKNFVQNAGFEDGSTGSNLSPWVQYGSGTGEISSSLPDTGRQHYVGKLRPGQNGIQLTQRIKGIESGKSYKMRVRYGLGTERNFGGGSCTASIIFRNQGMPGGQYFNSDSFVNSAPGTYQTLEWWVNMPTNEQLNPDGEYIQLGVSCGGRNGLSVDILYDSVLIVDASCSGDLIPQQPSCNSDTQWLDMDKNVCIDYPVCDTAKYEVLNKYSKTCEINKDATCEDLVELSKGSKTFTNSVGSRTFALQCKTAVTGISGISIYNNQGFKECLALCTNTFWPNKCTAVKYAADTRTCSLFSSATAGGSAATDGAFVV
ncbi:hypothetical protein Slin15195_G083210 [Septoria linicola]|uniref:Uncharacterized protein n=1 Tax=Septoria linicola TaxID=215465 RepID=A0A9Q9B016_9PEZI|nr:hypothetical protein Slin15195_G083210 [Septoria linicola]